MKLSSWIWLGTFSIVGVAIATKTNFLKNLINKVKNPPHGFFYDGQPGQAAPPAQIDPSILASISGGGRTDNSSTRIEGPGRISGSFQQGFYFYDNGGAGAYGSGGGGGGGVIPDVPSRGGGRQSWGPGNFPQGGYYDPLVNERYPSVINSQYLPNEQQPNFTQPLVPPNINKEIESQEPSTKKHHHKNKKKTHESQHDQVYTQVECPSDPNSVPCGYNCYINGQLMTVDCTTPYYYNPYRSGGPPIGPGPSQNNIHPTTPDQNLQNNNSQYNPYQPSYNQGNVLFYLDKPSKSDGDSLRMNGDSTGLRSTQSYGIYSNTKTFDPNAKPSSYGQGLYITSGGPGSSSGRCCGITVGWKYEHGIPGAFMSIEDWTGPKQKETILCGRGRGAAYDCDGTNEVPQLLGNTQGIPLSWHCDQKTSPGNVIYCGRLDGKAGCGPGYVMAYTNPTYKGQRILPGNSLGTTKRPANDPSRVREDGLSGNKKVDFGRPYAIAE